MIARFFYKSLMFLMLTSILLASATTVIAQPGSADRPNRSGLQLVYLPLIVNSASEKPAASPVSAPQPAVNRPRNIRLFMDAFYHSQISETALKNACGPTSLLMVLDFYGKESKLANVIQKSSFAAAQGGYDPTCTRNKACMSPAALEKVARQSYGMSTDASEGWTLEMLKAALAKGMPVIADIRWKTYGSLGHFVVIFGFDEQKGQVTYHDSYYGPNQVAGWAEFYARWNTTVDVGDPLRPAGHKAWGMAIGLK